MKNAAGRRFAVVSYIAKTVAVSLRCTAKRCQATCNLKWIVLRGWFCYLAIPVVAEAFDGVVVERHARHYCTTRDGLGLE